MRPIGTSPDKIDETRRPRGGCGRKSVPQYGQARRLTDGRGANAESADDIRAARDVSSGKGRSARSSGLGRSTCVTGDPEYPGPTLVELLDQLRDPERSCAVRRTRA